MPSLHEENASAINMTNVSCSTERAHHLEIQAFAVIMDWTNSGALTMAKMTGILNPSDNLTKALGWVLHCSNFCRNMGHFGCFTPK